MKLGINYPRSGVGHQMRGLLPDFGYRRDSSVPHWKRPSEHPGRTNLQNDLEQMSRIGIRALRWFILGSGSALGSPAYNPRGTIRIPQGAAIDPKHRAFFLWNFTMPEPDACRPIVDDFVEMLSVVRLHNTSFPARSIKLVPVWVDFRMFLGRVRVFEESYSDRAQSIFDEHLGRPAATHEDKELAFNNLSLSPAYRTFGNDTGGGGCIDILLDPAVRAAFYTNLVRPLLQAVNAAGNLADHILFWDIGNEMDMFLGSNPIHTHARDGRINLEEFHPATLPLYRFLSEMIRIHRCLEVTVSGHSNTRIAAISRPSHRTTVGWLYAGDNRVAGLANSLWDRAEIARRSVFYNVDSPAVEDVLQFHAYMRSHSDTLPPSYTERTVSYSSCGTFPIMLTGREYFSTQYAPLSNFYTDTNRLALSYSGWRLWPHRSYFLGLLPLCLRDIDDSVEPPLERRPRECIVGELALARYDGVAGNTPPEMWVQHFSSRVTCPNGPSHDQRALRERPRGRAAPWWTVGHFVEWVFCQL